MHNAKFTDQDTSSWMRRFASHYQRMPAEFPSQQLIVLFDMNGTKADLKHMVLRLLREYDPKRSTRHFRSLGLPDIDVNENLIEALLERMPHLSDEVFQVSRAGTSWAAGN